MRWRRRLRLRSGDMPPPAAAALLLVEADDDAAMAVVAAPATAAAKRTGIFPFVDVCCACFFYRIIDIDTGFEGCRT